MKVQINTKRKQKFISSYRKIALHHGYKIIDKQTGKTLVDCRIYYPATVAYCCLWVHRGDEHAGTGKAGGYGYHKESAAVADAIYNCAIDMDKDIGGVGDKAIKDALIAITQKNEADVLFVEMYP